MGPRSPAILTLPFSMRVYVIIPAAGLGTRMSASRASGAKRGKAPQPSKQFAALGGVPILLHTIRKFSATPEITAIYVALRKNEAESFQQKLGGEKLGIPVELAEGGDNRQESVAHALARIAQAKPSDSDIVLVHDAVRPFVERETISGVIQAIQKYGAAIAG